MIGKSISQYQILEKLGEGGMGVVYKAEDTKLKRTVAVKFLSAELVRDPQAKARFLQEARAAAALDHPNICTIHEINEAEGQTYIAMAYVEGKSLKERLAAGPLAISEALDIAAQVAEGLKRAHGKGIIHRDIKPANIMLTEEGRAKIMDFGLAKLTTGPDVTKTLTVMGTIAYMSPEQARGETVDHRTDIWSFGAMLYEMLTGQTPFGRRREQASFDSILPDTPAVLHSILYDPVEPPGRLRKDLPRPVEQVILKALDKDRNRRYQRMDEVLKDLKAAQTPQMTFPKPEKSIVILPFENISPDPEQEYFCDGMTEEIITDLSHVHDLLVISRSSAMTFKGTKKTIPEIACAVNVRYVLEGSVRKAGNSLRIAAQLIDAETDVHLWAEKYSGTLDDVFDIQEKVSRSIVKALRLVLTSEEKQKIAERPIPDLRAYDFYLRHRQEVWKGSQESLERALGFLQKGMEIIGENALLFAGMANVYFKFFSFGIKTDEGTLLKAEEFTNKVFSLEPDSSYGYLLLGQIRLFRGTIKEAFQHFKRVAELAPNDPDVLLWLVACYAVYFGKPALGAPLAQRAATVDPLTAINHWLPGAVYWMEGKYGLALESVTEYCQLDPESLIAKSYYAQLLAWNRQFDKAFGVMDELAKLAPKNVWGELILFLKYALQGHKVKAMQALSGSLRKLAWRDFELSWFIAECFSLINERPEALRWLEHAVDKGFCNYPLFSELDPFLANIRGEPRFQKLMERVKYEWEHFEV